MKFKRILKTLTLLLIWTQTVSWAAEEDLYDFLWLDPDKSVYVLQNRAYKKAHSFAVEISYLKVLEQEFQDSSGFDLKATYFFNEVWGVEAFYTTYQNQDNSDYKNVVNILQTNNSTVVEPFVRRMDSAYGVMAIWSPFYGKVNTFNKIFYFDWSFGIGLAKLETESNLNSIVTSQPGTGNFTGKSYTGLAYKTSIKGHISKRHHISLEFRNFNYQAPGPRNPGSDKLRNHIDLMIGFGFKF